MRFDFALLILFLSGAFALPQPQGDIGDKCVRESRTYSISVCVNCCMRESKGSRVSLSLSVLLPRL